MMSELGELEKHLMNVELLPSFPFINPRWEGHVFVTANYLLKTDFEAIKAAALEAGDNQLNVLEFGVYEQLEKLRRPEALINEVACHVLPLDWDTFDTKIQRSIYGQQGIYLWGESKAWGVICPDDYFYYVAGEKKFIEVIESHYGGYDAIKSSFECWVEKYKPDFGPELIECFYS